MLPQAGALDTGAGGTRAITGALEAGDLSEAIFKTRGHPTYRLLQHATTDTCTPLANFLDLSASGGGEATAHFRLSRLGRIAKFVHEALGLRIGVHSNRTGEGSSALGGCSEGGIMFLEAVEEKLLLGGQLLVPRGTHLRHTVGKTSARIVIHWETVGHHLTSGSSNHGQLRLARIGGGVRGQRNVWQRGGCGLRLILRGTRQGRYRRSVGTLRSA